MRGLDRGLVQASREAWEASDSSRGLEASRMNRGLRPRGLNEASEASQASNSWLRPRGLSHGSRGLEASFSMAGLARPEASREACEALIEASRPRSEASPWV